MSDTNNQHKSNKQPSEEKSSPVSHAYEAVQIYAQIERRQHNTPPIPAKLYPDMMNEVADVASSDAMNDQITNRRSENPGTYHMHYCIDTNN